MLVRAIVIMALTIPLKAMAHRKRSRSPRGIRNEPPRHKDTKKNETCLLISSCLGDFVVGFSGFSQQRAERLPENIFRAAAGRADSGLVPHKASTALHKGFSDRVLPLCGQVMTVFTDGRDIATRFQHQVRHMEYSTHSSEPTGAA